MVLVNDKKAGVIGCPISHSRSPQLHSYWLKKYKISGAYLPFSIEEKNLKSSLEALFLLGFGGVNVTIPHKERVFDLCHHLTPRAQKIGAVNTLSFDCDGCFHGDNTDGYGFMENIYDHDKNFSPRSGACLVLGAGGAARSIIASLLESGAQIIYVFNHNPKRAQDLVDHFNDPALHMGQWDKMEELFHQACLFVNTTPLGMSGRQPLLVNLDCLHPRALVCDIVYTPLITPLLSQAKDKGLKCVDGLGMLLHQARPGFHAWFGKDPLVDEKLREFMLP